MHPTTLQTAIDEAIAKLTAIRESAVATTTQLFEDDPASLRDMSKLSKDIALAIDPLFLEIAYQGGLASKRDRLCGYGEIVTDVIDGNLEFELTDPCRHHRRSKRHAGLLRSAIAPCCFNRSNEVTIEACILVHVTMLMHQQRRFL